MKSPLQVKLFLAGVCVFVYLTPNATFAATRAEVEAVVRERFRDVPVMIEIARCESNFRQFTDSGSPLRGPGGMVGVFQFFEAIHTAPAKALGFDITTLEGNLGYAKYVYDREGTAPWNSARSCFESVKPLPPIQTHIQDRALLQKKIELLTQLIALLSQQLALKTK